MFRYAQLAILATLLGLSACTSPSEALSQGSPAAVQTALSRGQFELNCPAATGSVLSSRTIDPVALRGGFERAEYTVGVAGCGQRGVYLVVCPLGDPNCVAVRQDRS
jgi:hypothetical protein